MHNSHEMPYFVVVESRALQIFERTKKINNFCDTYCIYDRKGLPLQKNKQLKTYKDMNVENKSIREIINAEVERAKEQILQEVALYNKHLNLLCDFLQENSNTFTCYKRGVELTPSCRNDGTTYSGFVRMFIYSNTENVNYVDIKPTLNETTYQYIINYYDSKRYVSGNLDTLFKFLCEMEKCYMLCQIKTPCKKIDIKFA